MSTENGAWQSPQKDCNQGEKSADCNFKPDYDLSTPRAQQWAADSQVQRTKPLDLNENGEYKVRWGDSLSTIAERALKGSGAPVSKDSLQQMQDAIVEANKERYNSLGCNRDLVKENWQLKIPGLNRPEPVPEPPIEQPLPPVERPLPPIERPMPRPPMERPPCPPEDRMPPEMRELPNRMPMIINEGTINIFMGRPGWGYQQAERQDWGRERDMYQWSGDYERRGGCYRSEPQPIPYRPEYYHEPYRPEPRGCSPCEQRQYRHNQRMPQQLRRNPSW